jgi:APA family basic amino acid/polyamine antiporter
VWAAIVAMTGKYDQILNYVVTIDALFFGLTGAALFIFRRREPPASDEKFVRVPWHPFTTGLFVLACWCLVFSTLLAAPLNAGIGVVILAIGAAVYWFWARPARIQT